jgi:uncharacterized coiled-coil DUF342 family protein
MLMATITQNLAGKMAAVRKEMNATVKAMQEQTPEIDARHDEVVGQIKVLDAQLLKDPNNEELLKLRGEYDRVRSGLYAASEYGTGLAEMHAAA